MRSHSEGHFHLAFGGHTRLLPESSTEHTFDDIDRLRNERAQVREFHNEPTGESFKVRPRDLLLAHCVLKQTVNQPTPSVTSISAVAGRVLQHRRALGGQSMLALPVLD